MNKTLRLLLIFTAFVSASIAATCDYCLNFTGSNCFATCGASSVFTPTGAVTLEAWIYSLDSVNNQKIAGNIDPFSNAGYELGMDQGLLYCEVKDVNGVLYSFKTGSIPYRVWTHIAFTYSKGDALKGYVNGIQVSTSAAGSADVGVSPNDFIIGAAPWDQNYFNFYGNIDEVRVYSLARTVAQIRQDMRIDVSGLTPGGLIGYWRFMEGTGTSAVDLTTNANTAVLSGVNLPTWTIGDGPYGIGTATSNIVSCCTTTSFTGENFAMTPSILSIPEVFVTSYINCDPGGIQPVGSPSFNYGYWVLDRYVVASNFQTDLTFNIDPLSISVTDVAGDFELYYRAANSNGAWTSVATGSALNSITGTVTFSTLALAGQFMIGANGNTLLSVISTNASPFNIYPNPAITSVNISTSVFKSHEVCVSDMSGRMISSTHFFGSNTIIDIQYLSPGFYLLSVDNAAPKQVLINQ